MVQISDPCSPLSNYKFTIAFFLKNKISKEVKGIGNSYHKGENEEDKSKNGYGHLFYIFCVKDTLERVRHKWGKPGNIIAS